MTANEINLQVVKLVNEFNSLKPAQWHSRIKAIGEPFGGEKNPLRRKAYALMEQSVELGCWFIVCKLLISNPLIVQKGSQKRVFYPGQLHELKSFCNVSY